MIYESFPVIKDELWKCGFYEGKQHKLNRQLVFGK